MTGPTGIHINNVICAKRGVLSIVYTAYPTTLENTMEVTFTEKRIGFIPASAGNTLPSSL